MISRLFVPTFAIRVLCAQNRSDKAFVPCNDVTRPPIFSPNVGS